MTVADQDVEIREAIAAAISEAQIQRQILANGVAYTTRYNTSVYEEADAVLSLFEQRGWEFSFHSGIGGLSYTLPVSNAETGPFEFCRAVFALRSMKAPHA